MNKLKEFVEKNGKIIEFIFSLISLIIVGVVGTTISINNSLTSTSQLELARANAQPVFNIRTEYNYSDVNNEEKLIISIEDGFAENLNISEHTWLEMYTGMDKENTLKRCVLTDYFVSNYYSGNNRGDILYMTNNNNLTTYTNLYKNLYNPDFKFDHLYKLTVLEISYRDVTGKDLVKYYETNGAYFKHIDSETAGNIINTLKQYQTVLLKDLTIDYLNSL